MLNEGGAGQYMTGGGFYKNLYPVLKQTKPIHTLRSGPRQINYIFNSQIGYYKVNHAIKPIMTVESRKGMLALLAVSHRNLLHSIGT